MGDRTINNYSDEAMNQLYRALLECADDTYPDQKKDPDNYHMYQYMNETPRTSFVAEIVNKLRENGFNIVKI